MILTHILHGLNWRCMYVNLNLLIFASCISYIPKYPKLKNISDIIDKKLKIEQPNVHSILSCQPFYKPFIERFLLMFGLLHLFKSPTRQREVLDIFMIEGEVIIQRLLLASIKVSRVKIEQYFTHSALGSQGALYLEREVIEACYNGR